MFFGGSFTSVLILYGGCIFILNLLRNNINATNGIKKIEIKVMNVIALTLIICA